MKKLKQVYLIIFCLATIICQAQPYFSNNTWTEYGVNTQYNSITSKRQYWTANDTVINGETYKKIVDESGYIGAIREENGKVYARLDYGGYLYENDEFLLYDFAAQVGDTIKSTALEGALFSPDGITVRAIDEIELENGEKRKRFFFNETSEWIEGIGSVNGLFHDIMAQPTNYNVSYLVCFQQNDVSLYVNTEKCLDGKCCEKHHNPYDESVFPESNAIWNIHSFVNGYFNSEYIYGLSGDTIINDKLYNKLYLLNDTTLNIDENDVYVGGFRQENKQVWFLVQDGPVQGVKREEFLIYDFSKEEGETVESQNVLGFNYFYPDLTLNGFESSVTRKIIKIEDNAAGKTFSISIEGSHWGIISAQWIEGIGSTRGLFWDFYNYPMHIDRVDFKLACFKLNGEVKYLDNSICNSCFCYSTAGIAENNLLSINVFQENDFIKITGEPSFFPCKFILFNLTGQLLFDKTTHANNETIPVGKELKGTYLYLIQKDNAIVKTGKIMIK